MHTQVFHPANNEDGYVAVICHRERYLKELLAMGWFETADEAKAKPEEIFIIGDESVGVVNADAFAPEPEEASMSMAGLSKSQRKKLRLNK